LGVPVGKLPRIILPTNIVGRVSADGARATGLAEGTPIVAGVGDQSAGFVGAGITRPGRMGNVAGTYPVLASCTAEFRPDLEHRAIEIFPSPVRGLFNPCTVINGGGLTHHWFQATFGAADAAEAERAGRSIYEVLDAKAATLPPGSDGLFFNPHLGGRMCPTQTRFRGSWLGFTWTHRREHFYRSVLESVAYDQAIGLRLMRRLDPAMAPGEVRVYGGGARSALWNQIKADVLGIPCVSLQNRETAGLGDAIIAGCAIGLFDDLASAAERFTAIDRRFEPDPAAHRRYERCVEFYERMLDGLAPIFDDRMRLPDGPDPV
jgi:xylulokinase